MFGKMKLLLLLAALAVFITTNTPAAAQPPAGFERVDFVTGLNVPTSMAFAPDGRLFITQQSGSLRVIKDGALLPTPFLTVSVVSTSEQGLLGVAFDPNFATNRYLYVYYTASETSQNRTSRFTASSGNPDVAEPGSELIILDNIAGGVGYHNGGALHFGPDGMLYVGVGDGHTSSNAQSLSNLGGKLLRINPANYPNIIPTDNPFVGLAGAREEVWAYGLRNPFSFGIDPVTGKIYVNDVGKEYREEINFITSGSNYGWPSCEGPCSPANSSFEDPIYNYPHGAQAAVTGGVFYRGSQFPGEYAGDYFFADYLQGFIKRFTPSGDVLDFETVAGIIDLDVGSDGSLYLLNIFSGKVEKIAYVGGANRTPTASASATPSSGVAPLAVSFDGSSSSDSDGDTLTYAWDFGDSSPVVNGVTASHVYNSDGPYTASLTVDDGNGKQAMTTVAITVGNPPVATITTPTAGTTYNAGDTINYAGNATDIEDSSLPASAFSWTIKLHHVAHSHPFLGPINGATSGSFVIPTSGENDDDVWYRIYLTVTDSSGLTHQITRDVIPNKSTMTFATTPPGLKLALDGLPFTTPQSVVGVVGMTRSLGAPSAQAIGCDSYQFNSWSDSGGATHTINTSAADVTYTASYNTGTGNIAANETNITASVTAENYPLSALTDGNTNTSAYIRLYIRAQWIKLDLGNLCLISQINVRHYYGDGRTYHDVIIQLSEDGVTWVNVFNNDSNNSAGQGSGADAEYAETAAGKTITLANPVPARYIRSWTNGSSVDADNHHVELEVYGTSLLEPVDLDLTTVSTTVVKDNLFTVDITVNATGSTPVNAAQAYLNFDPAYLQVVDASGNPTTIISPGPIFSSTWQDVLQNAANNTTGQIDFAGGKGPGGANATAPFVLATVRFKALQTTPPGGVTLLFNTANPRKTKATSGTADVTGQLHDATLTVKLPPDAVNDAFSLAEGGSLSTTAATGVLSNDTNLAGYPLTATLVSPPTNGNLTLNGNGSFSYTPNPGFNGPDSFTYQASDGVPGSSDTATVAITVTPINTVPTANAQTLVTDEDTPLPVTLSGSDAETASPNLAFTVTANPTNGALSGSAPNLTYTPTPGFSGADSFAFTVTDRGDPDNCGAPSATCADTLTSNPATVTLTVNPVNDAPVATAQSLATNEGTPLPVTLSGSDAETASPNLAFTVTANPANGALSGSAPNLTYTPNPGFNGADSFAFTVTDRGDPDNCGIVSATCAAALTSAPATIAITVTPVNSAPAANPQTLVTDEDTPLPVTLSGADAETASPTLAFTVTANPANGVLAGAAPNLTYTPNPGFSGADSFAFTVTDRGDPDNCGIVSATCAAALTSTPATVNLTINPAVTFQAQLQGRSAPSGPSWVTPFTVAVYSAGADPNTTPPLYTFNTTTDETGQFTLAIPAGVYDLRVKGRVSLRVLVSNVDLNTPPAMLDLGEQVSGDFNDDNVVDISDYSALLTVFGQAAADLPPAQSLLDFNQDGVVDVVDYAIVIVNFGLAGVLPL